MYKDNQIWQRLWFTLCLFTILGLALPVQTVYAQDAYYQLSSSAQSIVASINQIRANAGLQPVQVNSLLTSAAQGHAADMANNRFYGHTGSDGSNVRLRVRRAGYSGNWIGENWVLTSTPEQAMQWWMADPPHAQNILQPNYNEIGIGEVRDPATGLIFWVTDFARAGDGTNVYQPPAIEQPATTQETVGSIVNVESIPAEGLEYKVRSGDTLLAIGLRYNIAWEEIATANGINEGSVLQIGQSLRLPGKGGVGGPLTIPRATFDASLYIESYALKAGDTLSSVAGRYGLPWEALAAANGLGEFSLLQIGQTIKVPSESKGEGKAREIEGQAVGEFIEAKVEEPAASTEVQTSISSTAGTSSALGPGSNDTYVIQAGDTLFAIASRYEVELETLLALNGMDENSILQLGQTIQVPAQAPNSTGGFIEAPIANNASVNKPADGALTYTVRTGDTMYSIAIRFKVDWQTLLRINNMDENSLLQPGQVIRVK